MKTERVLEWIPSVLLIIGIPIFWWACWKAHYHMVKNEYCVRYLKKATYRDIKKEMLKTKWHYNPIHPTSLFTNENAYFHASIFRFGDVGYLLTPYGYLMASLLQKKIRKTLPEYHKSIKPYIS